MSMIGKTISHYEILEKLGEGGMGEVYKARDIDLDRTVVLKFLKPHIDDDPVARKRFINEAKTASALDHRNVATIYEIGQLDGGRTFIAMAYYGGASLADEIARAPLELTRALDIAIQVGEGLAEAHRHDIVHRDIKPGNVIVTERGEAKILDFGLAKLIGQTRVTRTGTTMGTVGYMSPEQAEGAEIDRRADIWALGALLYESLVGKPPFTGTHEQAVLYAIIHVDPEPLTAQRAGLPLEIDRIVSKAMAKDPAQRFQTMDDMLVDLRRLRADARSSGARAVAAAGRPRAHAARLVGAGLAAGIAIGIGATKWLLAPDVVEPPNVRIVTNSGSDRSPAGSPDGKTIAFASTRTGVSQIWLKQISSGDEQAITSGGDDSNPRFSPDGSQVLFARQEHGQTALWRVPIVGGQSRRVVDDATEGAWSPDGSQLAFLRAGAAGEVWVAAADGTAPHRVHRSANVRMRGVNWSPDGHRIMVVLADPFGNVPTRFLIVSTAGDSTRTVDPGGGFAQTSIPVWVGGDRIAYALVEALSTTVTGQASRVVERSLDTGKVRDLVSLPMVCRDLTLFGPGQLLLGFSQQSQNLTLVEDAGTGHEHSRWLTRGASVDRQPAFAPDGRHVLFSSNRSGNLDLWMIDVATGAMTRITDDASQDWDPGFTPDGRNILWSSDRSGNFEVWMAASDGSGAKQMSHDGVGAENPAMTLDENWIIYSSFKRATYDLWRMRRDGSDPQPFIQDYSMANASTQTNLFTAATSTGQHVDRDVRVFTVDGQPWPWSIRLARSVDVLTGRPRWIGKARIAWVDRDDAGHMGVMVSDVTPTSAGAPRRLAGFDSFEPAESFDATADGSRVILSIRNTLETVAVVDRVPGIDLPRPGKAR